jgi:CheY-like chemotaxis protein
MGRGSEARQRERCEMTRQPDTGELDMQASGVRGEGAPIVTTPDLHVEAGAMPKVLAVDDFEQNLRLLEAMLEDIPCQVVRAQSGDEALALVATTDFAVMLLDVNMPGMDGYAVAQRARRMSGGKDLPIVFLTASDKSDYGILRGYGSGAVDVLFKPVQREVLE